MLVSSFLEKKLLNIKSNPCYFLLLFFLLNDQLLHALGAKKIY